jgi:adenylate cyclase
MTDLRTNRRLTAILASDVVGYSRFMANDEAGTLASLKRHRETVFDPAIAQYGGRVFKLMGDGALVEFPSVVDAVSCAVAIQTTESVALPNGEEIRLRIGINLGDVIIEDDDIYGDGVNIAARLEPLAEPGGICVSSIVNESVGNRLDISFKDRGEVRVKNIDRPIRVWKWQQDNAEVVRSHAIDTTPGSTKELRSIAVLAFDNMSGNPEEDYFSSGISEDIITDLSKVPGLMVIARNSSFSYKGKSVDIRTVGRELGVQVVLEGSVRRAANRVRVNAQLIDAESGMHLWAERYDREMLDLFVLQDDLTEHIVSALKITLTPNESQALSDNAPRSIEAHDLVLRGRALIATTITTREMYEEASALFRKAIELDPAYAEAYAYLSILYSLDYQNHFSENHEHSAAEGLRLAEQAIVSDTNEPLANYAAAVASVFGGDLERALAETEAALTLNPNFALAHDSRGVVSLLTGKPLEAIAHFERAMRLDPAFSEQFIHFLGMTYLVAGKYTTAAAYLRERVLLVPNSDFSRAFLASALGHIGETEDARRVWQQLREINADYSFEEHIGRWPFKDGADVDRIRQGLIKAGLL